MWNIYNTLYTVHTGEPSSLGKPGQNDDDVNDAVATYLEFGIWISVTI